MPEGKRGGLKLFFGFRRLGIPPEEFGRLTICVVIANHTLLPGEKYYLNSYNCGIP
jgi:hypothetical protein